jgi:signal transduction histidine kinase
MTIVGEDTYPLTEANLEHLLRQQESLRQVIESISSELELRPLLTRIIRHACELIGADNGTIGLVDEQRQIVRTEAAYHMPESEIGAEMSPGVGLAGQVFLAQQPVILSRYGDVEQPTIPGLDEYAVIGLPIFWGSRMIGFFGIGAAPPRRFTKQDVETLTIFARHAAIAIENARLFEAEKRRAARIAIINRVGRLIAGSLDLDQLLQTTVEAIAEYFYYHNVALLLIDPADPETLVLRARSGIYVSAVIGEYRQKISQGIIGAAIQDRHYLLINDVRRDPRYLPVPGAETIYAELAVPIIIGDRLVGALNIESEQPMGEEDAAGFEIIADQLGVTIENARLFAETQHALNETQLLYQTSQRISTAIDEDEVIEAYLEQVAVRGRYACNVVLYEFDELGQRVAVAVRGRWTPQEGLVQSEDRFSYTRDALDPPLDAGHTVTIADVYTDPRVPSDLRQRQAEAGRPALALIPLMVRSQRIGLVVLSYSGIQEWQVADLHPYQVTAAQLAAAIDSRRQQQLLAERSRQLAVFQERQRLARDLHDSVTQLIFSMTLIAQSIAPAWRRDPAEAERRINRLLELSQSSLAEMRALLAELRPLETVPPSPHLEENQFLTSNLNSAEGMPSEISNPPEAPKAKYQIPLPGIVQLQRDGLVPALQSYIAQVTREGLQINLDSSGYLRQPLAQEETLYRIAQEALNNVIKHARAQQVELKLRMDDQSVYLTVVDDGVGFVPKPSSSSTPRTPGKEGVGVPPVTQAGSGLGLTTMRERAEALGGTVQWVSVSDKGTTVTVTLPRKN